VTTTGTVFLVGAGPGDPDLITVRGRRLVESAVVIVHDRLGTEALLALAPPACELVDAGKAPGRHGMSQGEITATLIEIARSGRDVVRLKGGDPFMFGRGGEEAAALADAGVACIVVPGVTSAVAVPASVGIPVTHRGLARTVTVASGHDDPASPAAQERWRALAAVPGTLVLLMAMGNLDGISRALIDGGRPTDEPVAAIHAGTTPRERTLIATLATVAERCRQERLGNPAVVVVGPVVALGPAAARSVIDGAFADGQ
jgi:uroporphyrin-III C-methyltransferase/precorrin-2 dehydrogenase/sirohydrochlorin ferrochelatase